MSSLARPDPAVPEPGIRCQPGDTVVSAGSSSATGAPSSPALVLDLPPDLQAEAYRRLRVACVAVGVVAGVVLVAQAWSGVPTGLPVPVLPAVLRAGVVVLSAALFLGLQPYRLSPRRLQPIGLAYEVLVVLAFATADTLQGRAFFVQSAFLLLLFFPVLVPARPTVTFGVTFLAAAACMQIAHTLGPDGLPVNLYLTVLRVVVPLLLASMAAAQSAAMCRLRAQVASARQMGSYVLQKKLGEGGMGEVWHARHAMLARPAAVKLIRSDLIARKAAESHEALARFEREAQATGSLRSPHTVTLYDYGAADDGTFFYVMELLDGIDFEVLVERHGPLPPARVVYLLRQVCESLQEAHEMGMVHRDLKPSNIQACRMGREYDFVKVLDFGLVTAWNAPTSTAPRLTSPDITFGTPGYMAPEQFKSPDIGPAADLYALGCIGYWLLTGRPVFVGITDMDLATRHLNDVPTAPSVFASGPVPDELDRIILACLEKEPAHRPAGAARLSEMLAACPLPSRWTAADAEAWWGSRRP